MNWSFKLYVLIRLSLIILVTSTGCIAYFVYHQSLIALSCVPAIIIVIINLILFLNKTNERINYFFEAIINEDFSSTKPFKEKDKYLNMLNVNLNKLNDKLQQTQVDSQKKEHYLRALIDHIGTGILTYNEKGFVLHANSSVKNIFELEQLTHINQLKKVDEKLYTILNKINQKEQQLITVSLHNKQANLLIKANQLVSQNENLKLLSIHDIDQELDEKELDSWLKLIRVLTHEIMNSIAPVTSLSDSLSQLYIKDGQPVSTGQISDKVISTTIRGLEVIREQGRGLISFVETYRKLTRLPKPEKSVIDLAEFLERTIILCKAGISDATSNISIIYPPKDLKLLADEKMISQIVINLLKNAIEALSDSVDGKIEIGALINKNDKIEVFVKDNGPGIAPELIDEIFVPFFTTKEKGSGIGLSLSRQIMRLHAGSIKAHSLPGKETIFKLEFPV